MRVQPDTVAPPHTTPPSTAAFQVFSGVLMRGANLSGSKVVGSQFARADAQDAVMDNLDASDANSELLWSRGALCGCMLVIAAEAASWGACCWSPRARVRRAVLPFNLARHRSIGPVVYSSAFDGASLRGANVSERPARGVP
jgi:uncharacterized protein YjbI with pentapeptide repeats